MSETDEQLAGAYQEGDEAAFARLVERHLSSVYAFARRLSGSGEDAEDIAQEAFLKAWKGMRGFDSRRSFKAWLLAIARNAALDHLRRRRAVPFSALDTDDGAFADTVADDEPLADAVYAAAESAEALERALAALPADRRSVVLMHDAEDLTFEEIAAALGKPMNTVKSQYRRALAALRALL